VRKINIILILFTVFLYGCATSGTSNLEAAKFALDKGNYTEAITKATIVVDADAANAEAARVLASAYFARSGMDYFNLAEGIIDLDSSTDSNFQQIAAVLPATATEADLRSAIEVLEGVTGITATTITDEVLADAAFDLALMQIIEHFSIGVYGSDYNGTFDVADISETDAANVQADLLAFDNRLVGAGVDTAEESWVSQIRQTFWILEPISAAAGFTAGEYRAFVGCQLADDASTFTTVTYSADIADCDAINPDNQNATVQANYDVDTAL